MASSRKAEKQNIAFMELYKSVDLQIKEKLGSSEGVSEYIRRMEELPDARQDWKMLKHLRWARNKFAHEVDYSTELLKPGDYEWLEDFSGRLLRSKDILSLRKKTKKNRMTLWNRIKRMLFGR